MPDVSSQKEYEGWLERLANQTHPEILADNIKILKEEDLKHRTAIESLSDLHQTSFQGAKRRLGSTALATVAGEAAIIGAEAVAKVPYEPSPKLFVAVGAVVIGVALLKEFGGQLKFGRAQRGLTRHRDHIAFLTQKAEAGLQAST